MQSLSYNAKLATNKSKFINQEFGVKGNKRHYCRVQGRVRDRIGVRVSVTILGLFLAIELRFGLWLLLGLGLVGGGKIATFPASGGRNHGKS